MNSIDSSLFWLDMLAITTGLFLPCDAVHDGDDIQKLRCSVGQSDQRHPEAQLKPRNHQFGRNAALEAESDNRHPEKEWSL
jgi:hypothetical protein